MKMYEKTDGSKWTIITDKPFTVDEWCDLDHTKDGWLLVLPDGTKMRYLNATEDTTTECDLILTDVSNCTFGLRKVKNDYYDYIGFLIKNYVVSLIPDYVIKEL